MPKNEIELETLIHAVRIYSQDIRMEFGIEKCAILVIKSSKRHTRDGMELPNQDKIRTLREKKTYKYLRMLEANIIKRCSRNLIKGINTWAVSLVRYSGPFLKWTREELKQMDQRTRKLMTMHTPYILEMMLADNMCQEKKEEEDLPVLKTVLTHPHNDSKTTYKSVEED